LVETSFETDGRRHRRYSLIITATGTEILPLNCTSAPIAGASNATQKICTTNADVTLKGKLLSGDPLPAYSIEDPLPTLDGCTMSSILHPQWTFSAFEVDGNASVAAANDSSSSYVSFNIILQTQNPGFQFPLSVTQDAPVANSSWYPCALGPGGDNGRSLWPYDCSLQYSPATKKLTLKADWICSDLDPNHP
jgi:hypothetical protein